MAIDVKIKSSVVLSLGDSWFGVCPECRLAFPPLEVTSDRYFRDGAIECGGCQTRVDLWDAARSQVIADFPPAWSLQMLGARQTMIEIEMRPGQVVTLDLTKHEIPRDALLLSASYQMHEARGIPLQLHLFSGAQARDPALQALYCMPIQGASMEPGAGRGLICWVPNGAESQAAARIANAFFDLAASDSQGCVVEAFSGFEIALFTFFTRHLDRTCKSESVKRLLEGRMSSAQMMDLIPELSVELRLPIPPKTVWSKLDELRRCRNSLLHRGQSDNLDVSTAGDFLAAALIGVAFIRFLSRESNQPLQPTGSAGG